MTLAVNTGREPGLDLLRAIAIIWVMLYHYENYGGPLAAVVGYGWMGVDLFFVLSGYLIGWQLLRPYAGGGTPRWGRFFLRRAFRILPPYLAVLALYFLLPALREREGIQPLWMFLTFSWNLFASYGPELAFSHAWSLCVEEHFYLLLPPLVWLLARRPRAWKTAAAILVVLVGGMALRAWLWRHQVAPVLDLHSGEGNMFQRYIESIYYPTYTRLDGLLAGVTLAAIRAFRPAWWSWAMARGWLFLAPGLAMVVAAGLIFRDIFGYTGAVAGYPLLSVGLALVLVAAASPATWPGRVPIPGVRAIASMAFSLYLIHKMAYHQVQQHLGAYLDGSPLLGLIAYNLAALAAGTMLYFLVERPALTLRDVVSKPCM